MTMAGAYKLTQTNSTHRKYQNFYLSKLTHIFNYMGLQDYIMKILEIIKQKLGLDDKDLEKEIDLESVKSMQRHLDDVADELIAEQTRKEQEKLDAENKEWKDKMDKARSRQQQMAKTRSKLRHMKGISPARLMRLRKEGKL